MRSRLRRHVSSAHVLALVALFVALGGGAYAALNLPKNSVGTRQLKRGAVTPPKLSRSAIKALRGPKGATGAKGPKGAAGAKGGKGAAGDTGPAGPSDVYVAGASVGSIGGSYGQIAALSLPAGEYLLQAKTTVEGTSEGDAAGVACQIAPTAGAEASEAWDEANVSLPAIPGQLSSGTVSLAGAVKLNSSRAVVLACKSPFGSAGFADARVWAIESGAVHGLPLPTG